MPHRSVVAFIAVMILIAAPPTRAALAQAAPGREARPAIILLVGASGMIGSRILAEAAGRGHPVIAAARHPERIAAGTNIRAVQLDATDVQAFIVLARHADVIVIAIRSRRRRR